MNIRRFVLLSIPVLLGTLILTGCPPKKKLVVEDKKMEDVKPEDMALDSSDNDLTESKIEIGQDWTDIPSLGMVQFGYDSSSLDEENRAILKKNVAILKSFPASVTFRVEGHCDSRGTVEYNIALGQKRANTVSQFYSTSGIGKSRIKTISFGEERPLCMEESDECWAQNRRGTTKAKNEAPLSLPTDSLK
jgi:peptidoglycan-associated lipoprotein